MVTTIPDDILENLLCDVCYKFLSVKPVKVFPGKKVICGRCLNKGEDNREGVVSLYGLIADHIYFPCVNRYYGCNILLATSQVASHEENCESKCYICPICNDKERIPTFRMIKHFRESHREALLKTPVFTVDPRESLRVDKWFLYRLENKLIFINCFLSGPEDTVFLNARHLGDHNESEIITQKCILHYGSSRIDAGKMCVSHNETDAMGLSVSMSSFNQKESIIVYFEINISRLLLSKIPLTHQSTALKKPLNAILNENGTRKNASLIEIDLGYSEDDLIKPRVIFVNSNIRSLYSIGPTFDYCITSNKKVFLRCIKCEELVYTKPSLKENYVDIIKSNKEAYLVCKICYKYISAIGLLDNKPELVYQRTCFPLISFPLINMFCIWNCYVHFPIADVDKHEIECDKQPSRLCPVESCLMKGKLSEIETHFEEHSLEYSLSFDSSIVVQLSPTKQIMKQFLMVRNNVFVYVELTWAKYKWHMKFMLCGEKEKDSFAGMKLKAMTFNGETQTFLELVEQPQILEFHHMESVLIKCFLEKNNEITLLADQ